MSKETYFSVKREYFARLARDLIAGGVEQDTKLFALALACRYLHPISNTLATH